MSLFVLDKCFVSIFLSFNTIHEVLIIFHFINSDAIQQKVHNVGKRNFTRKAFTEIEVKMIKIVFLQRMVGRDI